MNNSSIPTQPGFKADVNRSTYRWKIYLTNNYSFYGYSKKEGKEEVKDKVKLLMRKIIMLKNKNYFDHTRTIRIEIFQRTQLGEYNELLCTLYPFHVALADNLKFNTNPKVQDFLKMFYDLVRTGNIAQLDYSYVGYSNIKEEDIYRMFAGRFKNIDELQKYCNELIIQGHVAERVQHFQRQYKENYF